MALELHPLTISAVTPETDAAIRVSFEVPNGLRDAFRHQPGQYLTLEADVAGERLRRSYSICSGVRDPVLEIAIKRVEGGKFSNFANDRFEAGMVVDVALPEGDFFVPLDPARARRYLFIAAGSGITPVHSNLRSILEVEPRSTVTLLYGNRRTSTILFRESLAFLKNRHLGRFQWINILSREDQGADILNGRLDNRKGAALNRRLIDLGAYDEYFICGPESMISEVSRGLRAFGIDEARIHYELFAASAEDARAVVEKHHARAREFGGRLSDVTVIQDGRANRFELSADGENVLDAALGHGIDLPFSCKGGVCATCRAMLVEGEVDLDIAHGLSPAERDAGYILTCQAHPLSDRVVIDFDRR